MNPNLKRLLWSLVICSISAVPSFTVARANYDPAAMVSGVLIFAMLYVVLWSTESASRFIARRGVARTMQIGYGIRLLVSIILPIGISVDLIPGMASVSLVESAFGRETSFTATLNITLLQGVLLHIPLAVLMLILFPFVLRFSKPVRVDENLCHVCGYDLCASPVRCPECGTPRTSVAAPLDAPTSNPGT